MSAKICGLVWKLDLPREEKYVLLCLGDHSDHDGNNVFPSIGLVAWKTDYSERRIQELMRRLYEIPHRSRSGNLQRTEAKGCENFTLSTSIRFCKG